jgi:acetyl/propionyl-CoA carboxylase alpha subunit
VPVVPGTQAPLTGDASDEEVAREAQRVGFPLMVKAVAGGGGKGMRVVESADALVNAVRTARSEAGSAFGDTAVYFERRIMKPRHIEIQLLADHYGTVVPFVERECSIQRRHQKVVEESPSMASTHLRRRIAGRRGGRSAAGYTNAGTIEFLLDEDSSLLSRDEHVLQVEHPVTEMGRASTWCTGRSDRARRAADDRSRALHRGHAIGAASTPRIRTRGSCRRPGSCAASVPPAAPASATTAGCCRATRCPSSTTP